MVHSKHGLKESLSSLSTTELESQAVELWKVCYLLYSILYSGIIPFVQELLSALNSRPTVRYIVLRKNAIRINLCMYAQKRE